MAPNTLGNGEKSRTQSPTHSPSLFDAPETEAFALEYHHNVFTSIEHHKQTPTQLLQLLDSSLSVQLSCRHTHTHT